LSFCGGLIRSVDYDLKKNDRSFYNGILGDNINIMLVVAAFNFKRIMNKWETSFWLFLTFIENLFFIVYRIFSTKIINERVFSPI
jgi:hypothetical protein